MIDVRKLRMLAELDRLGTIAAVAEELQLTAPGISMQLSTLEKELGVTLTERQGRRLALTPAGKLLAEHGRDVLDRLSLAELEVESLRLGTAGTYRLAAFPSAARTFVADTWRRLSEDSGIQLTLSTPEPAEALANLVTGLSDVAVVHSYSNVPRRLPEGIVGRRLESERVWLAIRADDAAAAPMVDIADLSEHSWVAPQADLTCYEMVDRACGLAGFRPKVVAESVDFAAQLELVAAGAGVALVPGLTVSSVPEGVTLCTPTLPLQRHIDVAYRSSLRGDAGVERIVEVLAATAKVHVRRTPTAHA